MKSCWRLNLKGRAIRARLVIMVVTLLIVQGLAEKGLSAKGAQSPAAGAPIPHQDFVEQRLSNGLRVIIAPDHTAPVFAIAVTYNVGSLN